MVESTVSSFPYHPELRGQEASIFLLQSCELLPLSLWFGWEVQVPPFATSNPTSRPLCLFRYTIAGEGVMTLRGREYALPPGTGCFLDHTHPATFAARATEPTWEFLSVQIHRGEVVQHARYITEHAGPTFVLPPQHRVLFTLMELFHRAKLHTTHNPFMIAEQLYHMTLDLHQCVHTIATYGEQHSLALAIEYIERHYAEVLAVAQIADYAHVSESHLYYLFRTLTAFSPAQFLTHVRLQAARELLRHTSLGLAVIAQRCGFCSAGHLGNRFKQEMGITPAAYRKQWKTAGDIR